MENGHLKVVLCWHMHQPWYRDGLDGAYQLPWVYLHGIKDYSDMAAHLERHPRMRTVVNFAPVLLEQLDEYATQIATFLDNGQAMQDGLLNLFAGVEPIPDTPAERHALLADCQRCFAPRMIEPYPHFVKLLDIAGARHAESTLSIPIMYLSDQYFLDVLTWYHLVWLGYSLRDLPEVKALFAKGESFTLADRLSLLAVMQECLVNLIPRYKALAQRGQIELSMTPYMHPIVPLLHDFNNMRDALPDAPAPDASHYPGGKSRAYWHMEQGLAVFEQYFGHKPHGVWLSEGGVSEDALDLLDQFTIRWTASGEGVWRGSCHLSKLDNDDVKSKRALFMPYQQGDHQVKLYFRDDGLSDLIGFKYSDWQAKDASADFVSHLHNIAAFLGDNAGEHVVSVILDGENAWEYYADNGHHFLDSLYAALSDSPQLEVTTFAAASENKAIKTQSIPRLSAGSWVYGSFSTWIGSVDKNRGWDYLVAAKQAYDAVAAKGLLSKDQWALATRQLAVCEGSDWFWWFGDYNAASSVQDFERLYRQQLRTLYRLLNVPAPSHLDIPLSHGGGQSENAGTMRRNVA